ncbi:thioredoxin [Leptospira wolbachii serovar Codice str. CDC]|uniref:Thioredoxin n=1 Tax=Leptospira wolbachii serovar Codice str. CDC TaxID=1218599 RepID=R9AEB6_9LEPT|nr:thioredoxin [Leptospira wolbachii serovar Codice str. CDC]
MPVLLFILFFFSCGETAKQNPFLPESLPTEDAVKRSLSSDVYLVKLNEVARLQGKTLPEWKEWERSKVTDKDIGKYWPSERKSLPPEISDTDAIDRLRESIRIRIVWSRMFHQAGISWKEKTFETSRADLLRRLDLRFAPKFGYMKAKWFIVEWSDYLCTFCRDSFPHTKNILAKYKSQIFYVHKDFPLDGDSDEGLLPLALGRCLWEKDPEHFQTHIQLLYSNSKKIMRGDDLQIVEWEPFRECQVKGLSSKYISQVRSDMKEAAAFGVSSVPTFWVNGRWIVGALNAETWERVLKDTTSH